MSNISLACPQCQQHIQCEADYAGAEITCPTCSTQIVVPETPPASTGAGGCPSCGVALPRGAVICTRCGYNLATGQHTIASRPAPQRPTLSIDGTVWYKTPFPYFAAFGLFMVLLCLLGLRSGGEMNAAKAVFLLLFLLYSAVVSITTLVCIFRDSFLKGLITILFGPYALYWVYVESGSNFLKAAVAIQLLLWVLLFIIVSQSHGFAN